MVMETIGTMLNNLAKVCGHLIFVSWNKRLLMSVDLLVLLTKRATFLSSH